MYPSNLFVMSIEMLARIKKVFLSYLAVILLILFTVYYNPSVNSRAIYSLVVIFDRNLKS